jgi:hypothetical protein
MGALAFRVETYGRRRVYGGSTTAGDLADGEPCGAEMRARASECSSRHMGALDVSAAAVLQPGTSPMGSHVAERFARGPPPARAHTK